MLRITNVLLCLTLSGAVTAPIHAQNSQPPANSAPLEVEKLEAVLAQVRARNGRDYAITTPGGIDEARFVAIGGIEQWMTDSGLSLS